MLGLRKAYLIRIYPEVYGAFERLCDGLMLKCIDADSLGLPYWGDNHAGLIYTVNLLKKVAELKKKDDRGG